MKWPQFLTFPRKSDFVVGTETDPYLRRWWVIPRNKYFNVYLHQFCRSDDDRAMHDHSYWNMSILLSGSYREYMTKGPTPYIPRHRGAGAVVIRRPETPHRISLYEGRRVWTLFITGPRVREWGFHCDEGKRWIPWQQFVTQRPGGNVEGPGCD